MTEMDLADLFLKKRRMDPSVTPAFSRWGRGKGKGNSLVVLKMERNRLARKSIGREVPSVARPGAWFWIGTAIARLLPCQFGEQNRPYDWERCGEVKFVNKVTWLNVRTGK
jgi:hypothetical protein